MSDLDAGGFGPYIAPEPPRPGPGHNNPPLKEVLQDALETVRQRKTALLEAHGKAPAEIPDEETKGKVIQLAAQLKKCSKAADDICDEHKKPILELGRMIDAERHGICDPLLDAARDLDRRVTAYERRRREAEARARAEAAAKNAPIPDSTAETTVRGDLNTKAVRRLVTKWRVTGKVPLEPLREFIDVDAAIGRAVRAGRKIKNVEVYQEEVFSSQG